MLLMTRLQGSLPLGIDKALYLSACVVLAAFPALMFVKPSLSNTCYGLLLGWSAIALAAGGRAALAEYGCILRRYWPFMLAMAALPLAVLLQQLLTGADDPHVPYLYLRFALFIVLVAGMLRLGRRGMQSIQWGFVACALIAALWLHEVAAAGRPSHVGFSNVIPFGNLALLTGMLAVISIGWNRPGDHWLAGLKLLAGFAGLYASYMSGTRGGWLAIPVLALIALAASRRLTRLHKAGVLVGLAGLMALGWFSSAMVQQRTAAVVSELSQFVQHVTSDTSIGVRLQLWRASLELFQAQPWTGVGPEHFETTLQTLATQHVITPLAATMPHSHNELLHAAATLGIPGLLAILALYLVPAVFFLRHLRGTDRGTRVASAMGLALCCGFMVFGLTEVMFATTLVNAFYSLVMAFCFAYVVARQSKLPAPATP
ncbi:O-antigen ligase family protein [Cupriavidus taiwanensis]|uniref:O-antigen ligase family protein n=1 Tax=Cupriavidus taiwanensis TaxID=164546 RepID=UPI000E0FFF93|nr:O-antigen ligase family protein [Cupriavidus taiwanensis]SPA50688.1 putative lipopolysaccharide o-antigen ligase transmembrane protein [Cupriavidus taiwanensis]